MRWRQTRLSVLLDEGRRMGWRFGGSGTLVWPSWLCGVDGGEEEEGCALGRAAKSRGAGRVQDRELIVRHGSFKRDARQARQQSNKGLGALFRVDSRPGQK